MLVNPSYPVTSVKVRDVQAAARTIGLEIDLLPASTSREIDAALTTFVRKRPDALFVGGDPLRRWRRITPFPRPIRNVNTSTLAA